MEEAKTLENSIRGERYSAKHHCQPSRRLKRLRIKPNMGSNSLVLEALTETTVPPSQEVRKTMEMLEGTYPIGDDEERIPTTREGPISNHEEIADIPDPPPTVTVTWHSKRLS